MNKDFLMKGSSTVAVHGGNEPDPMYAHITPIYASSTFYFDTAEQGMERFAGEDKTQIYSRLGNPGFKVAEQKIAALEAHGITDKNGKPLELKALLHASGQAAMSTLFLSTCKAGDKILTHFSLYGGTQELLMKVLKENQIEIIVADLRNKAVAEKALETPGIKLVHLETPANPTLSCVDLELISSMAKAKGLLVSVDNTFASPYLQQPFRYDGVDFVFHSTTKYLNGHGSAIGGVLLGRDLDFMKINGLGNGMYYWEEM
ncbi:PLP-dependent transferase, partial [Flavihumibacter sp. CACIAM 22H1]|uniref:PLP-dependent transferase n=1 Tax=Flavihumibacter sp. CACIAM 22H1 TaxID=1812911 RepID=UPI0025C6492B